MSRLFIEIVNMSIRGGSVVLIVLLLRLIFRKAPKWIFCLLWAMAAFRLIFPFSIECEWSGMGIRGGSSTDLFKNDVFISESGAQSMDHLFGMELYDPQMQDGINMNPNSVDRSQVWTLICSCAWLTGMSGVLLYALIGFGSLKRRIAEATILRENIKQSERVISPFVMGVFRPMIYLPYAIDEADRELVILHEQAHILRRDHLSKLLAFVLLAVHWFNPLVWLAYVLFNRDMEAACDERVIAPMTQEQRRAYAAALLNCAAGKRVMFSPLAFGETGVKQRILGVMKYKKPELWLLMLVLIVSAAAGVYLLTDPVQRAQMEPVYYKNAASAAANAGELLVIYCPAEPEEDEATIQIGGANCMEFSSYLLDRKWREIGERESMPSPGSAEFVIGDMHCVTIYDSNVAKVDYGGIVQWYRTAWRDYKAALELIHEPPIPGQQSAQEPVLCCTVINDARTVYLELGEYIGGDFSEESVMKVQSSHEGVILFYPEWECDELVVNEYYHERSGNIIQGERRTTYYLKDRNESGAYELSYAGREGSEDNIEYYVQGKNGSYIFKLVFGEGVAVYPAAVAVYRHAGQDIEHMLTYEETRRLEGILLNKPMYSDSPSCGFTEDVSVRIGEETYCIANDACPIVYVSEREMYINLSKEENETLRSLLENYGFIFPCL